MNTKIIRPPSPIKTGMIMLWSTNTAPPGWLLCYGQAVSRLAYAKLFNIIGTVYGVGDGSTTFNVPDYRGRVPVGKDNMGGASANRVTNAQADTIGGATGNELMALHSHSIPQLLAAADLGGATDYRIHSVNNPTGSSTGPAGTGSDNMIPYLTTNYIIKT